MHRIPVKAGMESNMETNTNTDRASKDYQELLELRQVQKKFQLFIQMNPDPMLIWDTQGRVIDTNAAFLNASGWSREKTIGATTKDFDYVATSGEGIAESIRDKRAVTGEATLRFPKGVLVWIRHTIPILDDRGDLHQIISVYSDITDLRKNMEMAKTMKERADAIVQENPYPIILWDTDLKLVMTNRAMLTLSGWTQDQSKGISVRDLKYRSQTGQTVIDTIKSGKGSYGTAVIEFPAGLKTIERHNIPFLDNSGKVTYVLSVYNDLTAQKKAIEDIITVAEEAKGGNLRARTREAEYEGDVREIARGINNLLDVVTGPFSIVNARVMDISANTEEANASIEEISAGAAEVARNAENVSTNAEKGNQGIRQVLRAMEDLAATVSDVATKAEHVSQRAVDARTLTATGTELAEKAERGMAGITKNASDVDTVIKEINAQMAQIGKIIQVITDLANQTNLLALNAAIEAARAGEAGRGFAVVATEVKALAQESRSSAGNIAELIGNLQKQSTRAAEAAGQAQVTVREGSSALAEMLAAFNKIAASIDTISKNAEEVAGSTEEQAAAVEEITSSVHEVGALVQGSAQEAQNAAAASEETSASIDQIARVVANLNGIAEQLAHEMGRFTI
jgi:methyl-accepting chemotaxis protein